MMFKDEQNVSNLSRFFFMAVIFISIFVSGWLMFADENGLLPWLRTYAINGDFLRRIILMSCLVIYFFRLLITVFVFLKRKMLWLETIIISILMSFVLFSFARVGGNSLQPVGVLDYVALLLYLSGSFLNTYSEYTRYAWKKKPEHKGRLYTGGLFKYSMHINYFGDIVLFSGFAILTCKFSMLIIPLIMALNFVLFIIPKLDAYLAGKYEVEFEEYAGRTKKFVPMVY
ncbi:MAG: DUF1295 domain-containing protein [bacterium]|nr:DUF1295 domain-containing protein [bacterium]